MDGTTRFYRIERKSVAGAWAQSPLMPKTCVGLRRVYPIAPAPDPNEEYWWGEGIDDRRPYLIHQIELAAARRGDLVFAFVEGVRGYTTYASVNAAIARLEDLTDTDNDDEWGVSVYEGTRIDYTPHMEIDYFDNPKIVTWIPLAEWICHHQDDSFDS
jgi:hypothetical protein